MNQERRNNPRIETGRLGLIARDSFGGDMECSVANLSAGGLLLIGRCRAEVGGTLQLSLSRSDSAHPLLHLAVQVTWKHPAATPESDWIGARISSLGEQDAQTLQRILQDADAPKSTDR